MCYGARRTSAFEKNHARLGLCPLKKTCKTFLNCVIHQSSKNFLEMDLLSVLYLETLAGINVAIYIHVYLMDRFCIVAKDGIKHSTNVCEINFKKLY